MRIWNRGVRSGSARRNDQIQQLVGDVDHLAQLPPVHVAAHPLVRHRRRLDGGLVGAARRTGGYCHTTLLGAFEGVHSVSSPAGSPWEQMLQAVDPSSAEVVNKGHGIFAGTCVITFESCTEDWLRLPQPK